MKKLLRYLKGYEKETVLAPLFKLLEAVFELLVPLVVRSMIDRGIGMGDKAYLVKMFLVLVALGVVGMVAAISAQFFAAKAAVGFSARLRDALFSKLHTLSWRQLDTMGVSAMLTRMGSDISQAEAGVNLTLRLLLRSPFIVFGAMVMAFTLDTKIALIFAGLIAVLSVAVWMIMGRTLPRYQAVQAKTDGVTMAVRENLAGVRVIRAFGAETAETEAFVEKHRDLTRAQITVGRISALLNPLTAALINAALILLLYTGAIRVDHGILTSGAVVALYNYLSQILVELLKLANMIITVTRALACGSRLSAVLDLPVDDTEIARGSAPASSDAPLVTFENVTFAYSPTAAPALRNVSFSLSQGGTLGVIGGTGSGKSTLAHLIGRFYEATQGTVRFLGQDVRAWNPLDLRSRLALVPQKAVLFRGTLRENLLWGNPSATDEMLLNALQSAQCDFVFEKEGLETQVEQGGRNFSGGQRQRLTIARALAGQPQLLILDDSSSALDFATDAALRQALRAIPCAKLIIAQRTGALRHADTVLVLENGDLVGCGTHEELLQTCSVYREIYAAEDGGEEAGR